VNPTAAIPDPLIEGKIWPTSRGFVDGDWYIEEDGSASRLAIRVTGKLHEERSPFQKLAVFESSCFGRFLTLDDVVMFTERDEAVYHEMLVHVPLCSMPEPRNVLIIGGGDAGCLREALKHRSVQKVVQVDIDERVTRVCQKFFPWVGPAINDPRAELIFADGVEYVSKHAGEFDVVIIDSTDPVGPAVGLFLRDFYARVANTLSEGGIMTAQTESPSWGAHLMSAIYPEMRAAFAEVTAYIGCVPSYPSGSWSWAFASNNRKPHDFFDAERAALIEKSCQYYNSAIHRAAFALPNHARQALAGENPFEHYDRRHRQTVCS